MYIHRWGGIGVGTTILNALEKIAIEKKIRYLEMDASINAESFYLKNGYRILEHRTHKLSSGQEMKCTKMRKVLI
ncbi:GNAT family N-acetyltransferase [Paenibacillus solisilvae]|uniref:GNAT family N-acetyltransferase n=1 Tax=Paenibacillus solisilvae TaxID=2486751 RepID=A0ABW0VUL3_9BACL